MYINGYSIKTRVKKLKSLDFWLENSYKYLESPVCACGECNLIEDLKKDRENIRINIKLILQNLKK